jgi:hypothetical protein
VFETLQTKAKGFRTLLASGAVALVGFIQLVGVYDITPVLHLFLKNENIVGAVLIGLGIIFAALRMVTNTPAATPTPEAPLKATIDAGT